MFNIKNKMFKFFLSYFNKEIKELSLKAITENNEQKQNREKEFKYCELEDYVNKPVICISNEWETPVIGFGDSVQFITLDHCPILKVFSYLDNTEYLIMGKVFHYNKQRFDALFKLTPFELCSFLYNIRCGEEVFHKEKRGKLKTKEEVLHLLEVNGFFKEIELKGNVE